MRRYPKFPALGQRDVRNIFDGPVEVTEKVDGSQIVFGNVTGELRMCSTGAAIDPAAPAQMFAEGVAYVNTLKLPLGFTYYCEYLRKPRHNVLAYARVPKNHLCLFAVRGPSGFLGREDLLNEATALDIDPVPALVLGDVQDAEALRMFMGTESYLGGAQIEGVVVKNYNLLTDEGSPLTGKFVSDRFREVAGRPRGPKQPKPGWEEFVESFRTEARWAKAVQRLRDAGTLKGEMSDIGSLLAEVKKDVALECRAEIEAFAVAEVLKRAGAGLPEWWRAELTK